MQIELHNDTYFHPRTSNMQAKPSNKPSIYIDKLTFQPHNTKLPTFNELHNHKDTTPHDIANTTIINIPSNHTAPTLYQRISNNTDRLFFILYTPANTLSRWWYLVQSDIKSTMHINDNYHNDNFYVYMSLAKYPFDVHNNDGFSRWWPNWYEYTTCPDTGQIVYGDRVHFTPSCRHAFLIKWAT